MTEVSDVEARIDKHEAVCAERYAGINAQLKRLEAWFVAFFGAMLVLMATYIIKG